MGKYHILKEVANGVIDERGKFYPFIVANDTVDYKVGIRYFVKTVLLSGFNDGDHAASALTIQVTVEKNLKNIACLSLGASVAATQPDVGQTVSLNPGVICDINTPITRSVGPTSNTIVIVYCELDETEGEYFG